MGVGQELASSGVSCLFLLRDQGAGFDPLRESGYFCIRQLTLWGHVTLLFCIGVWRVNQGDEQALFRMPWNYGRTTLATLQQAFLRVDGEAAAMVYATMATRAVGLQDRLHLRGIELWTRWGLPGRSGGRGSSDGCSEQEDGWKSG